MRKKLVSIPFVLLFCFSFSRAQTKPLLNSLSLEIGKTGLIYNLIYDHQFLNKFGIKVGGGSNFSANNAKTVGGGVYYLLGKSKHHFETGLDLYYLSIQRYSDDQKPILFVYPGFTTEGLFTSLNIGYRRYGKKSVFRVGLAPGIMTVFFIPGFYISYGIRF